MFDELLLLNGGDYKINDNIIIHHPTLKDICDYGEQRYFSLVHSLTCNPSAYKVGLFDIGIDYESISDFDFFYLICKSLTKEDSYILLGDLQLSELTKKDKNTGNSNEFFLSNQDGEIIIDTSIYILITSYIRKLHGIKKVIEKSGNKNSKKYLIEKDRRRLQYEKTKPKASELVPLISAMVNCEHFKYDHKSVWDLPIYVFNDSVKRIQKSLNYNQVMSGVYSGAIDIKHIDQNELSWLT